MSESAKPREQSLGRELKALLVLYAAAAVLPLLLGFCAS